MSDIYEVVVSTSTEELLVTGVVTEVLVQGDAVELLLVQETTELVVDTDEIEVIELGGSSGGGGAKVTVSSTAPLNPSIGDLWIME